MRQSTIGILLVCGACSLVVGGANVRAQALPGEPQPPAAPTSIPAPASRSIVRPGPPAAVPPAATKAAVTATPVPDEFSKAWAAWEAGQVPLPDIRLSVLWVSKAGGQRLSVYGPKVGVWNRERQFVTSEATLKAAQALLRKAGFQTMPTTFGGKRVAPTRKLPAPMQRLRQVTLSLGLPTKTVMQLDKGEQSAELQALVDALFALYSKEAAEGVTPRDLGDALAKMKQGELAADLLVLRLHLPQQEPVKGMAEPGWLLHLSGPWAELRRHTVAKGYSPVAKHRLSAKQMDRIVAALHANSVATLPINIVAAGYTDLSVSVMAFDRSIQARQFAGNLASRKPSDLEAISKIQAVLLAVAAELGAGS